MSLVHCPQPQILTPGQTLRCGGNCGECAQDMFHTETKIVELWTL